MWSYFEPQFVSSRSLSTPSGMKPFFPSSFSQDRTYVPFSEALRHSGRAEGAAGGAPDDDTAMAASVLQTFAGGSKVKVGQPRLLSSTPPTFAALTPTIFLFILTFLFASATAHMKLRSSTTPRTMTWTPDGSGGFLPGTHAIRIMLSVANQQSLPVLYRASSNPPAGAGAHIWWPWPFLVICPLPFSYLPLR